MKVGRIVGAASASAFTVAFLFLVPVVSYPSPTGLYGAIPPSFVKYASITYWAFGIGGTWGFDSHGGLGYTTGYSISVVTSNASASSMSKVSYTVGTTSTRQGSTTTSINVASQQSAAETIFRTVTTWVSSPAGTTTVTECSKTATVTVTSIANTNAQTTVTFTLTTTATSYGSTTTVTICQAATTTTTVTQGGG